MSILCKNLVDCSSGFEVFLFVYVYEHLMCTLALRPEECVQFPQSWSYRGLSAACIGPLKEQVLLIHEPPLHLNQTK